MSEKRASDVARDFVSSAICEWGQPDAERIASVQAVLDAAGIDATATCWPVFGGIWPKSCSGPEAERATAWLKNLTTTMVRGKAEVEWAHVQSCIDDAKSRTP